MSKIQSNIPANSTSSGIVISAKYHTNQFISQNISKPPLYYCYAITLLAPLYRFKVFQRSHKNDNYTQEVADRFGDRYQKTTDNASFKKIDCSENFHTSNNKNRRIDKTNVIASPIIWCHAVSLGETNTIAPLLKMLINAGCNIWLTNTTHTGYNRSKLLFAEEIEDGKLQHSFVPIDNSKIIKQFLEFVKPNVALFVETELWANTLYHLASYNIPSILVNARLSEKSFIHYQKIAKVSKSMMQNLGLIIAQDADSAKRFRMLGADSAKIRVVGSLKWTVNTEVNPNQLHTSSKVSDKLLHDSSLSEQSIQKNKTSTDLKSINKELCTCKNLKEKVQLSLHSVDAKKRLVWVAASTHKDEEEIAINTHQKIINAAKKSLSNSLLIIVPRHPERFDYVAQLISDSGLTYHRRSLNELPDDTTQVYLADSMGELPIWYEIANIAFVGGSMVNCGGHNPIEALSVSTPVVMGQYTQSCQVVIDTLIDEAVLKQIISNNEEGRRHIKNKPLNKEVISDLSEQLFLVIKNWFEESDSMVSTGQKGKQLVESHQSILSRQFDMIMEVAYPCNHGFL